MSLGEHVKEVNIRRNGKRFKNYYLFSPSPTCLGDQGRTQRRGGIHRETKAELVAGNSRLLQNKPVPFRPLGLAETRILQLQKTMWQLNDRNCGIKRIQLIF